MRVVVLFLSLITVNIVPSDGFLSVKLRPEVLKPDLEAILKYYENIDNTLVAYIHWPEKITYPVQLTKTKSGTFLKIIGTFATEECGCAAGSHDGLYYRNNKFYVESDGTLTKILVDTLFYVNQPHITWETSYISIKYFGWKEITNRVKSTFEKNRKFYELVLPTNPGIFLVTSNGGNHFLEYASQSSEWKATVPAIEGGVRLLVVNKLGRRRVVKSMTTSKILVDPKTFRVTIPDDIHDGGFFDLNGIFGVRMDGVGFLAEHRGCNVRMLSNDDVSGENENPDRHIVSAVDFLTKLRNVQPASNGLNQWFQPMPFFGKFQFRGHILVKSLNYINGDKVVDSECPFVIEFDTEVPYFLFGTTEEPLKKLCTNEEGVWPMGQPRPTERNIDITLMHPFARN